MAITVTLTTHLTMLPPFVTRSFAYVHDTVSSKLQDGVVAVLSSGPIPKHVAFVMDGNRRFARRNHKEVAQGHAEGFVALRRVRVTSSVVSRLC